MLVEHMDTLDAAKEVRRDPASPALRPLRLTGARASARCLCSPIIWVRLRRCDAALRLSAAPALWPLTFGLRVRQEGKTMRYWTACVDKLEGIESIQEYKGDPMPHFLCFLRGDLKKTIVGARAPDLLATVAEMMKGFKPQV